MGRSEDRNEWVEIAVKAFMEEGLSERAVASAFLTYFANSAPSKRQYVDLLANISALAEDFQALMNRREAEAEAAAEAAAEVPPEPPAEVIEIMKMLGMDDAEIKATFISGRPTGQKAAGPLKSGKYSGLECDCPKCLFDFGHMFSNGTDGEA